MKFQLPFVSRKEHQRAIAELKHRYAVYVPAEYPKKNGKPVQIPADDYAYHDKRIGWVRVVEFDTYKDYIDYLKEVAQAGEFVPKKTKRKAPSKVVGENT